MNPRLALKIAENNERINKIKILSLLPKCWIERVEHTETIPSWAFLQRFPVNLHYDLRAQPLLKDKLITYADFDDLDIVKLYLDKCDMALNAPVVCWFGIGPAFVVKESIQLKWLKELTFLNDFILYFAQLDFSKGTVCCEYLGCLEEDRATNGRETVYEIMTFE